MVRNVCLMTQQQAVLTVNNNFYTALSLADFALMERLWLASPDAVCVHPGWPALHGWDAIRDSWRQIFENQGPLRVWPSEVQVRFYGHTAEVACLENIDMSQVRGTGILRTRATNVFRQVKEGWRILEHHAVPMPAGDIKPPQAFSSN
jgi:ketosteroid isomerase-like protein